jgi:hypothetical protein
MVGKSETIRKRGSGKLAVESHFGARVGGCPKTPPLGWPQIADSIAGEIHGYRCPQTDVFAAQLGDIL